MKLQKLNRDTLETIQEPGPWVPSPLALNGQKQFQPDWQRLLTLYYIRSGARTVIPGAHTGEFAGNDLDLFRSWLKIVRETIEEFADEDMFLMAAVGGSNVMNWAEVAADEYYDLVMVAPTAFTGKSSSEIVKMFQQIASIIPTFAFELQQAIPGSHAFTAELWDGIFRIAVGAKGASFNTYRSQLMLQAAAQSPRREQLVLATGNDDRIVYDLGGIFPFRVPEAVDLRYQAGLLGHFATDTHAATGWSEHVKNHRDGADWELPLSKVQLAHMVNMCNGALFDAINHFENSVWGVKNRLTQLGLLPSPECFHEEGRAGMEKEIAAAYAAHPLLNDEIFLENNLAGLKKQIGLA
ncbi:MAG: hypothetical protein ACLFWL_03010 [Candidatus Brocadiia bacterium]